MSSLDAWVRSLYEEAFSLFEMHDLNFVFKQFFTMIHVRFLYSTTDRDGETGGAEAGGHTPPQILADQKTAPASGPPHYSSTTFAIPARYICENINARK